MERWERELEQLKEIDSPESMRERLDRGPTGDGMPPNTNRGQRVAAGVVACLVFLLGAALVTEAFRRDAVAPVLGPGPDNAVLRLSAEPNGPVATLSYAGDVADPVIDSYCWNQDNGAQACVDVFASGFEPDSYLDIPEGTAFTLVNGDDADPVGITLAPGRDAYAIGRPTTLDELVDVHPGVYALAVVATWEDRGEAVTFRFPIRIEERSSEPTPTPTPTSTPEAGDDAHLAAQLTGSAWSLGQIDAAMLDIEEPPTAIFSTTRLVGFNGCNGYGAEDWSVSNGRLATGEIAQTLILCPGGLEGRFMAILGGEPIIAVDGSKLTLSTDDGSMVFDRIDVDHDDVVGSFLDCAWTGHVDVPPSIDRAPEDLPGYTRVNLPWTQDTDEITQIGQTGRWIFVRDGLVIAELWAEDLSGRACRSSGA